MEQYIKILEDYINFKKQFTLLDEESERLEALENILKERQQDKEKIKELDEENKELNRMIGSLALYDFNDKVAEIGKIQIGDKDAQGKGIGRISFSVIILVILLGNHNLVTENLQ